VRELREFREHHEAFARTGTVVAGISPNTVEQQRAQAERLALPYRLGSDSDRAIARGLGALRVLGIGAWTVELYRRATVLIDRDGIVVAIWSRVKVRGHAHKVLAAIDALARPA
jgi:thioredoxin-dependent peroxiredoxin